MYTITRPLLKLSTYLLLLAGGDEKNHDIINKI